MRPLSLLLLVFVTPFAWAAHASRGAIVKGVVTSAADPGPVPGCTVTLSRNAFMRQTVTNARGEYAFATVLPGTYVLRVELAGLAAQTRTIDVSEDRIEPPVPLELSTTIETVTISCGAPRCSDVAPRNAYALPLCSDADRDALLLDAVHAGDPSALQALAVRFDEERSFEEKHRIAAALLNRVPDDSRYWTALESFANDAIRFAYDGGAPPVAYVEWCERNGVPLDVHRALALDALAMLAADPRAHGLVLRALATGDAGVAWVLTAPAGAEDEMPRP